MVLANLKIGMRLNIGFGLMLALLLFIAIEGITEMDAIQGSLEGIVNVNNRELALTNIISSKVRDIASYTRNMVLGRAHV